MALVSPVCGAWGVGSKAASVVSDGPALSSAASQAAAAAAAAASTAASSSVVSDDYVGKEYKIAMFTIRPAQHKREGVLILIALSYLLASVVGLRLNKARAEAWFEANESALRAEFAGVGMPGNKKYDTDGGDEYLTYATGRRGTDGVHVRLFTQAYHDPVALAYNLLRPIADVGWRSQAETVVRFFHPQIG